MGAAIQAFVIIALCTTMLGNLAWAMERVPAASLGLDCSLSPTVFLLLLHQQLQLLFGGFQGGQASAAVVEVDVLWGEDVQD